MVHTPRSQGPSPMHTSDWNTQAFGTELAPRTTSPTITCDSAQSHTSNGQTDRHGSRTSISRPQSDAHLRLKEAFGTELAPRTTSPTITCYSERSPHLELADRPARLTHLQVGLKASVRCTPQTEGGTHLRLKEAFGTELAPRTTSPTITCDSERSPHLESADRPTRSRHLGLKAPVRRTPQTGTHRRSARSSHLERPRPQSPAIRNAVAEPAPRISRPTYTVHAPWSQSDAHLGLKEAFDTVLAP